MKIEIQLRKNIYITVEELYGCQLNDKQIQIQKTRKDFRYGTMGKLEQSEVIVIRLKGMTGNHAPIQQPVTVQTKLKCSTCGKVSRSSAKFCDNCGTFLE